MPSPTISCCFVLIVMHLLPIILLVSSIYSCKSSPLVQSPLSLQEAERAKVLEKLHGWQVSALQQLLDCFDLPKPSEGNKEHKMQRVLDFLEKPEAVGSKDLAAEVGAAGAKIAEKESVGSSMQFLGELVAGVSVNFLDGRLLMLLCWHKQGDMHETWVGGAKQRRQGGKDDEREHFY